MLFQFTDAFSFVPVSDLGTHLTFVTIAFASFIFFFFFFWETSSFNFYNYPMILSPALTSFDQGALSIDSYTSTISTISSSMKIAL